MSNWDREDGDGLTRGVCWWGIMAVMLIGALIYGVQYSMQEYMCTFMVAGGVSLFAMKVCSSSWFSWIPDDKELQLELRNMNVECLCRARVSQARSPVQTHLWVTLCACSTLAWTASRTPLKMPSPPGPSFHSTLSSCKKTWPLIEQSQQEYGSIKSFPRDFHDNWVTRCTYIPLSCMNR